MDCNKEAGLKWSIIPLYNCIKGCFSLGVGKILQLRWERDF